MGYLHVNNLYKDQDILMFKECYALEKIHGSSAHLAWDGAVLRLFSGGESHEQFAKIFNTEAIIAKLTEMGLGVGRKVTVYGEVYGGKCQGMAGTYGKELKFVAFDVHMDEKCWLDVPKAEGFVQSLGLEFVYYKKVPTNLADLDSERDAPSVQAIRNGISRLPEGVVLPTVCADADFRLGNFTVYDPKMREGVVIRPLMELTKNNGSRVICKHKGEKFQETKTPRPVVDPAKMQILADAEKIADEWVTFARLKNIYSHLSDAEKGVENTGNLIRIMLEDIHREAAGEAVFSKEVDKAIGKKCAQLVKEYAKASLLQKSE